MTLLLDHFSYSQSCLKRRTCNAHLYVSRHHNSWTVPDGKDNNGFSTLHDSGFDKTKNKYPKMMKTLGTCTWLCSGLCWRRQESESQAKPRAAFLSYVWNTPYFSRTSEIHIGCTRRMHLHNFMNIYIPNCLPEVRTYRTTLFCGDWSSMRLRPPIQKSTFGMRSGEINMIDRRRALSISGHHPLAASVITT